MISKEELIKLREDVLIKQKDKLEKYLWEQAQKYCDEYISDRLMYYIDNNLTQKEMKINNSGIFITSENKEVTDSFFEVLKKNDCKLMKKEIDNISTKEDPIVYLKHYSDAKDEECSYYTRLLYIKNNAEMNNYNFDMHFNPCPDGYNNIWVEFFVLADLPTIEFSSQKIIIKKLKKSRK